MITIETVIAALLVQLANSASWAIRAIWKDWQRRRDQRHELKLRDQEMQREAINQGIPRGYDVSGSNGFNMRSPVGREFWRRNGSQRGQHTD